eukprot:g15013.t1
MVIFMNSAASTFFVTPGWTSYCSSKAALLQFAKVLAVENSCSDEFKRKLRVLSLAPGICDTEMIRKQILGGEEGANMGGVMSAEMVAFFRDKQENGKLRDPTEGSQAFAARAEDVVEKEESTSCEVVEGRGSSACGSSPSSEEDEEEKAADATPPHDPQKLLEIMQNVAEGKTDDGKTDWESSTEALLFQKCGMAPTKWRKKVEEVQAHPSWTAKRLADKDFKSYQGETETLEKAVKEDCETVKKALRDEEAWKDEGASEQPPYNKEVKEPAVAYLLLGPDVGGFEQAPLWEEYFKGCGKGTANLYVHAYAGPANVELEHSDGISQNGDGSETRSWKKSFEAVSFWKQLLKNQGGEAKFAKKVRSKWGQLFVPMWWLLVNALQNGRNQHFVFVSETSVPLKSCATVTKQLLKGTGPAGNRETDSHLCLGPRLVDPTQKGGGHCMVVGPGGISTEVVK